MGARGIAMKAANAFAEIEERLGDRLAQIRIGARARTKPNSSQRSVPLCLCKSKLPSCQAKLRLATHHGELPNSET